MAAFDLYHVLNVHKVSLTSLIVTLFWGCSLALTSTGPPGSMFFVGSLCPGAPEGSTGSGFDFKASQKTEPKLKVSYERLGGPGIDFRTPGYNASDLSTTPRRLTDTSWSYSLEGKYNVLLIFNL